MIGQIRVVKNLGRFTSWEHPTDDTLRFRRLTLLFARNGAGKTTLARILASSGNGDGADLLRHHTLDAAALPEVVLIADGGGVRRFDGHRWDGPTRDVRVFDREFVEANVYVGRRPHKEQRAGLLEIALGSQDVSRKKELDELAATLRRVTADIKPHAATIRTAAEAARLTEEEFLTLEPVTNADEDRRQVDEAERIAITSTELLRRPVPSEFMAMPGVDVEHLKRLLATGVRRLSDEAEAAVRAHLQGRLVGRGELWLREGLRHDDQQTCPYCGQDTDGVELLRHYRVRFDTAWDQLLTDVETARKAADQLDEWWAALKRTGGSNVRAFEAWSDMPDLPKPIFDSVRRRVELDIMQKAVRDLLEEKRTRLAEVIEATPRLENVAASIAGLGSAVDEYNSQVRSALATIRARCEAAGSLSVEAARRNRELFEARLLRHSDRIREAARNRDELIRERASVDRAKVAAEARLKAESQMRLESFARIINRHLADLGADFGIERLLTERGGGSAGAQFHLKVRLTEEDERRLLVAGKDGEEKFARVLSDGDRSTLALAVFLASLDGVDLSESILVFDDPMTSLDLRRCEATAEKITKLANGARQVLVFSHHGPFLAQVARDWLRHGGERAHLAEVVLEHGARQIRKWSSEDHVTNEHVRRWEEIHSYVVDPARDPDARHIHGEIRAFLEGYARFRWPDLFDTPNQPLEPVLNRLKEDTSLRETKTSLTQEALEELDRLCAFSAPGNHTGAHRNIDPPDPDAVRTMARRTLAFVR